LKLNLKTITDGVNSLVLPVKREEMAPAVASLLEDGRLELTLYSEREDEYFGEGKLSVRLALECSRCLKEIVYPLESGFSFTLKAGPAPNAEDSDENPVYFDPREEVADLGPLIAEEISLNVPIRALCDEACKGLCAGCGAALNEKECTCGPKETNPAWEKLKKLKGE
jgi:uncharacterized protein